MKKLILAVIMLVPAIGVLTIYSLVTRDIRKQNASGATMQQTATKVIHYVPPSILPAASQSGFC